MMKRILLIEPDTLIIRQAISAFTPDSTALRLQYASTWAGAEEMIRRQPPDLIIAVPTLPDGDGVQLCRNIRPVAGAPFVIWHKEVTTALTRRAFKAGALDVWEKKESMISRLPHTCRLLMEDISRQEMVGGSSDPSDRKYRMLFESISEAALVVDDETGRIIEVNRSAVKMYGFSRSQWVEMTFDHLKSDVDVSAKDASVYSPGSDEPVLYHKRRDGSVFPVEVVASGFTEGKRRLMIALVRDVSQRHKAQDLLQRQHEALIQTNRHLQTQTRELAEQKKQVQKKNIALQNAQRLLEEKASDLEQANYYKTEFLANMSHELRTPLNSILVLSKLIAENKDENLTEKQVDFIETVISAASDLARLISDVLDLSKVEAGKMDVFATDVHLKALGRQIEKQFAPQAKEKNVGFAVDVAASLQEAVSTDRYRLEQILKNFLSNAFKFTTRGSVRLSVHPPTREELSGIDPVFHDVAISFSVTDTGTGIPEDKQSLIFDAFKQADGSISRKYGGTGLGLSISRKLAELLGGQIHLVSQEGRGSQFTLTIADLPQDSPVDICTPAMLSGPFTESPMPVDPVELNRFPDGDAAMKTPLLVPSYADDRTKVNIHEPSILVVSSQASSVRIIVEELQRQGVNCLVALDLQDAQDMATAHQPQAIFLDGAIPRGLGWVTLVRLKEDMVIRHIPVFVMSDMADRIRCMKLGAAGCIGALPDPADVTEVFNKASSMIERPRKRLMVVEDDVVQRALVSKIFKSEVLDLTLVPTGAQGLMRLAKEQFDCVILDLGLPDMSGLELLNRIRNTKEIADIPIIIYTGRELTHEEKIMVDDFAEKIILKGAKSLPRLLDEATLFLHIPIASLPPERQEMLRRVHDSEQILNGKKILIADDNMRHVYTLTNILESGGIDAMVAQNPEKLMAQMEDHPEMDLLLIDMSMVQGDHAGMIRAIKEDRRFRNKPVIAMTSRLDSAGRDACIKAGANDYLDKPVGADCLRGMLRTWLY